MLPFRVSSSGRLALMGGGLLALVGAEGVLLWWLSAHPPTASQSPASTPSSTAKPTTSPTGSAFMLPDFITPNPPPPEPSSPGSGSDAFVPPPPAPKTGDAPNPLVVSPSASRNPAPTSRSPKAPDPKLALAAQKFEQAGGLLKRGDKRGALALWEQVAQTAPDDLATRQNLALVYGELNQPKAAIPHARAAVRIAPKNPAAQFQLARLLLEIKDLRGALVPLREAVRLAPEARDGHSLLARVLVDLHQPKAALDQWTFLARRNGHDLEAHLNAAAIANDLLKNPAESQKWLRRAQSQNPRDPQAPLMLSQILLSRRDAKGAASVLRGAIQSAPSNFVFYPLLAQALVAAKDRPGAIGALQSALSHIPKTGNPGQTEGRLRVTLGQLYGDGKQPKPARDQFERAAKLLPRDPEPRALAALAGIQLGDLAGATPLLSQAVALDPKNVRVRRLYAQTLAQTRQWAKADQQFAVYCPTVPRDKEALAQWARVARQTKNPARELLIWQKLAPLDAKNPLVWQQLGEAQLRANRPRDAVQSFQKMTSLAPRDLNTFLRVAELQSNGGDARGALKTLEKALNARPDYAPAYLLLLRAGDAAKQDEAARAFVAQKLATQPQNESALAGTLKFFDDKKRPDDARALLNAVVARNPNATLAQKALENLGSSPSAAATKAP